MSDWALNGTDFEDYGFYITGVVGAGVHPTTVNVDEYATLPGGEYKGEKVHPRPFTLIGTLIGTSLTDFHSKRQTLISALDTADTVTITYSGATVEKQITAYYEQGLEGNVTVQEPNYWERISLNFLAEDPYWYETSSNTATLDLSDSATFYRVAARENGQWHEMGPPSTGGYVEWITTHGGLVYIVGNFTNWDGDPDADYFVIYNPTTDTYSTLGSVLNGRVRFAVVGPDGYLYICGDFTNAGGDGAADYLAKMDLSADTPEWENVGGGPGAGSVSYVTHCAFDHSGNLYVVGSFTDWDGTGANYATVYDGSSWDQIGGVNPNSVVYCVTVDRNDDVYIGGVFTTIGVASIKRIGMYDGSWNDVGGGAADGGIYAIVIAQSGYIYAAGNFSGIGNITTNFVAGYNRSFWEELAGGATGTTISRLAIDSNGLLWAGGDYTEVGGANVYGGLGIWNGSIWYDVDWRNTKVAATTALAIDSDDNIWVGHDDVNLTATFAAITEVTNGGTADCFPVFSLVRSGGTTVILRSLGNETLTEERMTSYYSLLDGETIEIDFTQGAKVISSDYFGSRLDITSNNFNGFRLTPGTNRISCYVPGAANATGTLEWTDRYRSLD